jgi:hypothetical protein
VRVFVQAVDDTGNTVLDQRRVEVDQQAKTLVGQPQIGQKLFSGNRRQDFDRFDLDDHPVLDNQVGPEPGVDPIKEGRGCRTEGTFRNPKDFDVNKGLSNLPYLQKIGREINRRLLEVERVSHNRGLSGDSIQRVVQPTVTADGQKAPALKFGQPRVMALLLALTLFQHLIDGFHNRDLRVLVADLLGVTISQYTGSQMTYDLRRLRLKGLIFRPPRTHRYFVTPYGWKVARLFSRLEARVFRPAVAMFTGNDAVLPFPLRASLDRVDAHLDELIYEAFPQIKAA